MKEEKNIDRLFQETMKDLEAVPSSRVWAGIESKLQKKKRRVIPIWWLSGGVAALLIVSLFLFPFENDDPIKNKINPKEIITTTPEVPVKKVDTSNVNKPFIPSIIKENEVIVARKKSTENTSVTIAEKITPYSPKRDRNKVKEKITSQKGKKGFGEKIIPEHNITNTLLDSIQKTKKENKAKPLFPKKDFIASLNKDSITIKDVSEKWSVTPVFAVLNSSSFSGSSPISTPMEGNSSFSYGVKVNYKINSKWTIQSGVHLQKMSYSTRNSSTVPSASGISAINSVNVKKGVNKFAFGANGLSEVSSSHSEGLMMWLTNDEAVLNQSFDYIELPVEIKYNVISGKNLSASIVTGFSSLFLSSNRINVETENYSQGLGEATNLNSINFSGNFGIDLDYYFNKNWTININPMVKAQLNTFSENSNGFMPYSIGIYSGIKYSF